MSDIHREHDVLLIGLDCLIDPGVAYMIYTIHKTINLGNLNNQGSI
jgi:hypothetical protein